MEKRKIQFALMFPIILTVIVMTLILFLDVTVAAKFLLDLLLAGSTAIMIVLAWILISQRDSST